MVLQAKGRMSIRNDGKYFLYLPKSVAEDSAFPFKVESSIAVRVVIDPKGERILILPLDKAHERGKKRD